MVPKEQLGRANGLIQLSEGVAQIVAPLLAGFIVVTMGLTTVLFIDYLTFLFAVMTLLLVSVPHLPPAETSQQERRPFYKDAMFGWSYIFGHRGLLGLLIFITVANFVIGIVQVLLTPLVLTFASADVVGVVLTAAGLGFLLGSVIMSVWGGPRWKVVGILGFSFVQGLVLLLGGFQPNVWLVAGAAAILMFNEPLIMACSQTIWQRMVAPEIQGRVFAARRMLAWSAGPIAFLLAGPLADYVFEPLLAPRGMLSTSIGAVIGVGAGRGIGLLYMILGVVLMAAVVVAALYTPLRTMERANGRPGASTTAAINLVRDDTSVDIQG
jgi:DHA3 family macrolide efflux protein-like MFS transporter